MSYEILTLKNGEKILKTDDVELKNFIDDLLQKTREKNKEKILATIHKIIKQLPK